MARPSKSAKTITSNIPPKDLARRQEEEERLKGAVDKLHPPKHLTEQQKEIFQYIVEQLRTSEILGNLDIYILATCSIAIDRLASIESMINNNAELLTNSAFMASKEKYTKDLYRCCNELSLSPQSRAKLANAGIKKDEEDPLLAALRDDDTE